MITIDEAKFNADWLEKEGYKPEADFIRDLAQQVEELQEDLRDCNLYIKQLEIGFDKAMGCVTNAK